MVTHEIDEGWSEEEADIEEKHKDNDSIIDVE